MENEVPDAATWIEQCSTLTTSRGHRIAYRSRGTGPAVLLFHGFPTWSYDWAEVAVDLERDHQVVTFDFLGYGASDKPGPYDYSVDESADVVEELVAELGLEELDLVIHDYGSIVGQELLDRRRTRGIPFAIRTLTIFNGGLVYSAYRPTRLQKLLALPVVGRLVAGRVDAGRLRAGLDGVRGEAKLTDAEFDNLWVGISRHDGHKLAYLHIRYNRERAEHHARWEAALQSWDGPVHLIWGPEDPVSGRHVLAEVRKALPHATVTELPGVGHFPMSEAPAEVAVALRSGI